MKRIACIAVLVFFVLASVAVMAEGPKNLRYVAQVYRDSLFQSRTSLLNNNNVSVEVRLDLNDDKGRFINELWVTVPARAFLTVPYDQLIPPGDFSGWLEVNPKRFPVGVTGEIVGPDGVKLDTESFDGKRIWGFSVDLLPGEDLSIAVLYPQLDDQASSVFTNIISVEIEQPNFGPLTFQAFSLNFGEKKSFLISQVANAGFLKAPFRVKVLGYARFVAHITDLSELKTSPEPTTKARNGRKQP